MHQAKQIIQDGRWLGKFLPFFLSLHLFHLLIHLSVRPSVSPFLLLASPPLFFFNGGFAGERTPEPEEGKGG